MAAAGHSLEHLLWEQDMNDAATNAANAGDNSAAGTATVYEKMRHWSDAHRLPDVFPQLETGKQFDLVIASDCLYFMSQEEPLAASISHRLKQPHGKARVPTCQPAIPPEFWLKRGP